MGDENGNRDLAAIQRATDYLQGIPLEERVPGYGGGLPDWDKAQVLALLEDDGERATTTNCEACWHLWAYHGPDGCNGKVYPSHSLTGEPCPCTHTPPAQNRSADR